MTKLNQILGIAKGVRTRVYSELTQVDKQLAKPDLLTGISRTYTPKDAEGEQIPPESKHVQLKVSDALETIRKKTVEVFDIVATQEFANSGDSGARADIVIDDIALVPSVPVTYLLFLEKQLVDLRTVIGRLPVLDPAYDWTLDTNTGVYKTAPKTTLRTTKVPKAFVKYEATKEHPAQVEVFTEDVVQGSWEVVAFSGAIPDTERIAMLERVEKLINAVKLAREAANDVAVTQQHVGDPLLSYIFNA